MQGASGAGHLAEASERTLGELFLSPSGAPQYGGPSEPGAADKLAHCIEPLRCTPTELAADHLSRSHHTCSTRARPARKPNPTKGIGQRAHLFVACCIDELRFGERLAAAHDAACVSIVKNIARTRSMATLQLDCRQCGYPESTRELSRGLEL